MNKAEGSLPSAFVQYNGFFGTPSPPDAVSRSGGAAFQIRFYAACAKHSRIAALEERQPRTRRGYELIHSSARRMSSLATSSKLVPLGKNHLIILFMFSLLPRS